MPARSKISFKGSNETCQRPARSAATNSRSRRPMKAWVLGGPDELTLVEKPVPEPGRGRSAGAHRRDRRLRHRHRDHEARPAGDDRRRAAVQQELHPRPRIHGHGGQARPGGRRVPASATASRSRSMPAAAAASAAARACTPPASITAIALKGHRANGFTTDGGFAEYAVNHVNTMVPYAGRA